MSIKLHSYAILSVLVNTRIITGTCRSLLFTIIMHVILSFLWVDVMSVVNERREMETATGERSSVASRYLLALIGGF